MEKIEVKFMGTIDQASLYEIIKSDLENKRKDDPETMVPLYTYSIVVYGNIKDVEIDENNTVYLVVEKTTKQADICADGKFAYPLLNVDILVGVNKVAIYKYSLLS